MLWNTVLYYYHIIKPIWTIENRAWVWSASLQANSLLIHQETTRIVQRHFHIWDFPQCNNFWSQDAPNATYTTTDTIRHHTSKREIYSSYLCPIFYINFSTITQLLRVNENDYFRMTNEISYFSGNNASYMMVVDQDFSKLRVKVINLSIILPEYVRPISALLKYSEKTQF